MADRNWPALTLLGTLRSAVRDQLLALGHERKFPAKANLLRFGDPGDHAILLLSGVVKVLVHSPVGAEILLAVRVGGDLVGEMAMLDGSSRSANVVACGEVEARIIRQAEMGRFLEHTPQAAYEVSRMISGRLRWSDRRRVDFVARSPLGRLAHVLAEVAEIYGRRAGDRWELDIPLTQAELGSLAGMARRTVEKCFGELVAAGVVESSYRGYTVLDMSELRQVADLPAANPH
ncbi:Crp/Fnr family transcriptional regulator [Lentzea sp. NPDC051213]|uniref:Crp/Fnr family transcriptional regulator n=1 Tax=Lentzea sp. NPDC051213 TaxID=3364126 RepID=UPI0037B4A568